MNSPSLLQLRICNRGCSVCQFHMALVDSGALFSRSDTLSEAGCSVVVAIPAKTVCATKLKVDMDDAVYRQRPSSHSIRRMCDYVVVLSVDGSPRYGAIELKSREPYLEDAAEQLKEGLQVIANHWVDGNLNPRLRAFLVVGVRRPRLERLARTAQGRLEVGDRMIQIELVDCDMTLSI